MIRKCRAEDAKRIYAIINEAARAYDGVIEADCYHQPYMPEEELEREMKRVTFYGYEANGELVGIMGIEPIKDVTLIRHAYVLPQYQNQGIGHRLLDHLKSLTATKSLLVGTWTAAHWAITFYQKHGFNLLPDKDELLADYWDIPQRQIETSVVMGIKVNND
jgi:N-acetylglutamate synthase-like GNAT family acetyltransferase